MPTYKYLIYVSINFPIALFYFTLVYWLNVNVWLIYNVNSQ